MSIPRLELCGAHLLSQLLHYLINLFHISLSDIYAWTDSSIVLNWLQGSPRHFKVFVGNRVSSIIDRIPAEHWRHVQGTENPADSPSRGLFPLELVSHGLWWKGPPWLKSEWPNNSITSIETPEEEKLVSHVANVFDLSPVVSFNRFSSYDKLLRVTAWIYCFISYCKGDNVINSAYLLVSELHAAEQYWNSVSQADYFYQKLSYYAQNIAYQRVALYTAFTFVSR